MKSKSFKQISDKRRRLGLCKQFIEQEIGEEEGFDERETVIGMEGNDDTRTDKLKDQSPVLLTDQKKSSSVIHECRQNLKVEGEHFDAITEDIKQWKGYVIEYTKSIVPTDLNDTLLSINKRLNNLLNHPNPTWNDDIDALVYDFTTALNPKYSPDKQIQRDKRPNKSNRYYQSCGKKDKREHSTHLTLYRQYSKRLAISIHLIMGTEKVPKRRVF